MDPGFGLNLRGPLDAVQDCDRLWQMLADAVECGGRTVDAAALAERVNRYEHPALVTLPLSRLVFGTVAAAALGDAPAHAAGRLSALITRLEPAMLTDVLRTEGAGGARAGFLKDAARVLDVDALARTALAATAAWNRPVSPAMRELVGKLVRVALTVSEEGGAAEQVLRHTVANRLDTGPADGVRSFVSSASGGARPQRRVAGRVTPEADRIVYVALEAGASGQVVWTAVAEMVEQGRVRELIEALKQAPDGAAAGAVIRAIANTTTLMTILSEDPVDVPALDLLLQPMGSAAAKPMLEVLAESRSRSTRRVVLERLATFGTEIAPLVEARLRDSRWFVVRNMLNLLREAGSVDSARGAQRFLQHQDARVRREALQLLLLNPSFADDALVIGLRDADRSVLRVALHAARSRMPEAGVPVLAQRVVEDIEFPPEFRGMALHILARARSALALDALLHFAQDGRSLLGRPRLAGKSPEMIAALGGLARSWQHDRRAKALLDVAARSRDPQIASAVRAQES